MKAIITIDRNHALQAGVDNEGDYTLTFSPADLTPAQRAELAECPVRDGAYRLDEYIYEHGIGGHIPPAVTVPDLAAMRTLLDARIASRAEMVERRRVELVELRAQAAERIAAWAEGPPDKRVSYNGSYWIIAWPRLPYPMGDQTETRAAAAANPAVAEAIQDAESLAFWTGLDRQIEIMRTERLKTEAAKAAKAAAAAAAERQRIQVSTWVWAHGSDNQRSRHTAGLLPETEIIDAIRSEAYAALGAEPRYVRITKRDVCNGDDYGDPDGSGYHDDDITFEVSAADTLTAAEWDRREALARLIPGAVVTVRHHVGECSACENKERRTSYSVTLRVGELEFSREYAD